MQKSSQILTEAGFPPCSPAVRSSDLRIVLSNPFHYYLTRRLGLVPALSDYSEAMHRGTWMHKCLEHTFTSKSPLKAYLIKQIIDAQDGLRKLGKKYAITPEKIERRCEWISRDAWVAYAWYQALFHTPFGRYSTLYDYFHQPAFQYLGSEVRLTGDLVYKDSIHGNTVGTVHPYVVQLDIPMYDSERNCIRIQDLKSTSVTPKVRASTCKNEFQTQLYIHGTADNIRRGYFHDRFNIEPDPDKTQMDHVIVQTPDIIFGNKDRHYHWFSYGKRKKVKGSVRKFSGHQWQLTADECSSLLFSNEDEAINSLHERTGKKPEKVYEGEPDPDLYADRCLEWALGVGDYLHEAEDRKEDPVVNISSTSAFTPDEWNRFHQRCRAIIREATREPEPEFFTMGEIPQARRTPSPYLGYYQYPPSAWTEIIARERFVVRHRDDPTTDPITTDASHAPSSVN